jgi:ureidoglycolate hydrolase
MKVKVFPANQATAFNRATVENKILTIAQAGDQIMLEYISDRDTLETIVFKKQDNDFFVWHECAAQKSNYARGCWHMGLITWIYALSEQVYELELLPPLGNMVAEVDLTSGYLNRPGEFNIIKLDPQKVKESRAVETNREVYCYTCLSSHTS